MEENTAPAQSRSASHKNVAGGVKASAKTTHTKVAVKQKSSHPKIEKRRSSGRSGFPFIPVGVGVALLILAIVAVILFMNAGSNTPSSSRGETVAIVNGQHVTQRDVYEVGLAARQVNPELTDDIILNQTILIVLLRQEAQKQGITATPQQIDEVFTQRQTFIASQLQPGQFEELLNNINMTREQFEAAERQAITDDIVITELLRLNVYGDIANATDNQAMEFYRANEELFVIPEQREARHILICYTDAVACDDNRSYDDAQVLATELRKQLDDEPEKFASLADQYSPNAAGPGGELGNIVRGQTVPEFEQALFSMRAGQISQPVETDFGFHLILLEDIVPPSTVAFEDAKDRIKQNLFAEKAQMAVEEYLMGLRSRATIVFS